jgi:hypothetical protein
VGLRPRNNCSGKAQNQLYSNLQTRNCLKEISCRKKNWSQVTDGLLTTGQTGRLTVRSKLTATATATNETSYQLPVTSCNTCCTRFTPRIINVRGVSHSGTSPHSSIHFLTTRVLRVISISSFTPLSHLQSSYLVFDFTYFIIN